MAPVSHPFFGIIDGLGIPQTAIAAEIDYDATYFSKLRSGRVPVSRKLARRVTDLLQRKGIWHPEEGRPYLTDELFSFDRPFSDLDKIGGSLNSGAVA
jgi:hypothetical protein